MSDPATLAQRLRAAGCVFAEQEAALLLARASGAALERMVARRVAGEPLEHVLGRASFAGLDVVVGPGVFVPRRRTELLVELALQVIDRSGDTVVVDLCCGSAAVGAAIEARLSRAEVYAVDADPVAVACARQNLLADRVLEGDLYDALPARLRGRVDVIAVNAPYVPTAAIPTMPTEARDHEPRLALDGGPDGAALHRRVAAGAPAWLAPGGHLLLETSRDLAPLTVGACTDAGLEAEVVTDPDRDATAVAATLPIGVAAYACRL